MALQCGLNTKGMDARVDELLALGLVFHRHTLASTA